MLIAGALQDPVRKLMPGAPAIMVLSFAPIWLAACMNVFSSNPGIWKRFRQMYPRIAARTMLFMVALLLATVVLFKHGIGVWIIGVIGLLGYALPITAMLVGFMFLRRGLDFNKLVLFYCSITSIVMIGGPLEYLHLFPDWRALGTSAMGMYWVRYISSGHTITLIAGFYRSPDVMGWHAAMLVMLSLTMLIYGKFGPRWLWLLLIAWGVLCLLISGRNKMIFMPLVWGIVATMIYVYVGRGARVIYLALIGGVMVMALAFAGGQLGVDEDYFLYATPTVGKVFERVERHNVGGLLATYDQYGFFGEGIGTASTGRRHSGVAVPHTWQEGGLPKLLVELGVLGLLMSILLAFTIFKTLHSTLKRVPPRSALLSLQAGLLGIVAANASSFIISQIGRAHV